MHLLTLTGPEVDPDTLLALYRPAEDQKLVRLNFASTLDGAVTIDGLSAGIGGPGDLTIFGMLRGMADAVLVGAGTLREEHYRAVRPTAERRAWRISAGLAEYPRLVVVSGRLDIDPEQAAFADAPVRPLVITYGSCDPERHDAVAAVADVLVHGVDKVDLIAAVGELRTAYGLNHILCEGGPTLFGALHAADLVDEVCLTIGPMIAGPGAGRIIAGPAADAVQSMTLSHALHESGSLFLRYIRSR